MAEETNFNRTKNIDRELIRPEQKEEIREVSVKIDGRVYDLPRRLARSDIAKVFANSHGNLDSYAIDNMLNSTRSAEAVGVRVIKSLDPDVAKKLGKTLTNTDIVTESDSASAINQALQRADRNNRLEQRERRKESKLRQRQESQPDIGGVYDAEFDDTKEV